MLIPAAGAARRMRGGDKLLERVDGRPLLALLAGRARAAGCPVLVTLRPGDKARRAALEGCDVEVLEVADAAEGMAASLRAGAAAAQGRAGLMVLPGDMPEIGAGDMAALCDAFAARSPAPILRAAAADGRPGHPVVLPAWCFGRMARLAGDEGARSILCACADRVVLHPLEGVRALTDLDTPEDWAAWRAQGAAP